MIRRQSITDLPQIMSVWITSNIDTHTFVQQNYWKSNFAIVQEAISQAEVYVYEDENNGQIVGFIGLSDNFIAGLFVTKSNRSKGIGKQLLDYAKNIKDTLELTVYEKNILAIRFYQREGFVIKEKHIDEATQQYEFTMCFKR